MRNQYVANQNSAWPLSAKGNNMCQLNTGIDLRDFLMADLSEKDIGGGQVEIIFGEMNPVKNIKTPPHTTEVKIKVMTVTSAFEPTRLVTVTGKITAAEYYFSYIDKILEEKSLVLNTRAKPNDIVLVAIAIEYSAEGSWNTDLKYLPAAIVAMGKMS